MQTFYWHDYETWGVNPAIDHASQFAGVRTDTELNIIGDPLVIYCKPPEDIWPHPEACLVTGITPQKALVEGLNQADFIAQIHSEMAQPNTCSVGYNSLRFDDEVTRYTLFRNFYDPYAREWQNGNSRWDIIDLVRFTYALKPKGIEWPMENGLPSFKLELLTQANGISHALAHDAYSDVAATIAVAKMIKDLHPKLYDYVLTHKDKKSAASFINIAQCKPVLHVSSMFSKERGSMSIVVPLAMHPTNKNAVIAYDLAFSPESLKNMTQEDMLTRLYTPKDDLKEGEKRLPIKLIHLNKCPILATPKLITPEVESRINLNKKNCDQHWHMLKKIYIEENLEEKLDWVYRQNMFSQITDPEQNLYTGFIPNSDKSTSMNLRQASFKQLCEKNFFFEDQRLQNMVLRYKARNFPDSLREDEKIEWQEFVEHRLLNGGDNCLSKRELEENINALKVEYSENQDKQEIIDSLVDYMQTKLSSL